ncbi:LECE-like protein [Mya arenaria]|uniref:LECE-like protein n=1 Tax=Mya arenaria TaxID=6604 RepID=A0ABY7DWN3_MYAAR|nr:LECE-like protein [Mya arenaria]
MDCGLPSMPDNASISGNMFNIGMRVKFTCSEGTNTINGVWMSVQDFDVEGVYKLSDGSPVEFTDWQKGQPDNYADNDDCVNGWIGIQLQWNDIDCGARFWFICEYELNL